MAFIWLIPVLYALFALIVFWGQLTWHEPKSKSVANLKTDIIIPFKNEAKNLARLLDSLVNQTHPQENFEIYLVNDHSTDNGEKIVTHYKKQHRNIHLLQNSGSGKKEAIITGFKTSENEIILMTDADTTVPSNWVGSHLENYDQNTDMLIGSVKMVPQQKKFWHLLQTLEYKSISAVTNGMTALKMPVMCSAANLSFRRSAIKNISEALNLDYSSGDDMFLLQYFKQNKKTIKLNGSVTKIKSEPFKKFILQRIRWTGKAAGYSDFSTIFTGIVVMLMNLLILFTAVFSCFDKEWFNIFLSTFITKIIADTLIMIPTLKRNDLVLVLFIFPLSVIYPFYTTFVTISGLLKPKNKKGW